MNTAFRAAALLVGCASLVACAAPRHKNSAPPASLQVQTKPAGASVQAANGQTCAPTPCSIQAAAKAEVTATISKAGYKPAHIKVSHGFLGLRPKKVTVALKPDLTQRAAARTAPPKAMASASDAVASAQSETSSAAIVAPGYGPPSTADAVQLRRASAETQSAHLGRIIAIRVLLDGTILETHGPYD